MYAITCVYACHLPRQILGGVGGGTERNYDDDDIDDDEVSTLLLKDKD